MNNVGLEDMKDSYGYLFEIENFLRDFIIYQMEKEYGYNWRLHSLKLIDNSITKKRFMTYIITN